MSFSVVITTSIMIISMIVVLVTLANFIITYAVNMNKVLELKSIESNSQKAVLLIDNVSVEDSCITFRLRNLGPTSVLISSTSTLLVDYYTNETLEHVVEVLHYSISWYVSELIIGNNSYVVMSVGAVELRPGVIAIAKAFLSSTPSPNHVIVLVLTDDKGLGLSMSSPTVSLTVISTGNEELDTRLGGGLPSPSLIFIEGDNGTGKTALCTQFALGYLSSGLRVMYVITENTVRQFLSQTHNINLDLTDYFLRGQLNVVSASLGGISWVGSRVREVLDSLIKYIYAQVGRYDVFILDSLSVILHYINDEDVHTLLISLRNIVRMGKNIVITLHPGIISERLARELVAGSDVYFRLAFGEVGGRAVKVINVVKIRGSPTLAENAIAFDIDPAFGIKVVPLALAKA